MLTVHDRPLQDLNMEIIIISWYLKFFFQFCCVFSFVTVFMASYSIYNSCFIMFKLWWLNVQRFAGRCVSQVRVTFLCTAHLPNDIYLPTKFLVHIPYSVKVMSRTKFKMIIWIKGINSKIREGKVVVLVHCTSIFLQSILFISYILWYWYLFRVMFQTRKANRRTKRQLYAHPSGKHKKIRKHIIFLLKSIVQNLTYIIMFDNEQIK
jgi:hypothetical protein